MLFAFLLCAVGVVMTSCEEIQPIAVTSVTLNSTSMELVEGTTQTLVATVSPSNAENQKVIWSSNNSSVASVTDGVVTAIKVGTATITVKTDDGNKTATCNVTVVAKEIPVTSVSLDQTEIELMEGDELSLTATVKPENATNKNVTWTSSDERIAAVNNGKVTAILEGTATITVKTEDGGKVTYCTVTVLCSDNNINYIDEYGINQGKGVEIDGVVWAPVNCGYHETDYPWGKIYQWGRKYGQGYLEGTYNQKLTDATTPIIKSGPVSLNEGQSISNSNVFYKVNKSPYNWLDYKNDTLWNAGTESNPIKTEYDPCPEGWRVPTITELENLIENSLPWDGGYWFSGSSLYSSNSPKIFFPAAGMQHCNTEYGEYRGLYGYYWSSSTYTSHSCDLEFSSDFNESGASYRAYAISVRCVQE